MGSQLRIGIIGTGVGIRTLLPGFCRTGRAEVVALSGSSRSRAEQIGQPLGIALLTGDYREVCASPDVDLVCVASPNDLHMEHARAALASGKHVYLEKPTGVDAAQSRDIAELAKGGDRLVVVGHQLRFNPFLRKMRDAIAAGSVGRVYHLSIAQHGSGFANASRPWTWEFESERGGGVRLAMGSHLLDLASFLMGSRVQAVAAALDPVHRVRTPNGGDPRECMVSNYFSALVSFPQTVAHVSTTAAAHSPARFDVVAYGESGELRFDLDRKLVEFRVGSEAQSLLGEDLAAEYRHRQASSIFSTSFTYFADEIVTSLEAGAVTVRDAASPDDAAAYMEVLDAALTSYRKGTREQVEARLLSPGY